MDPDLGRRRARGARRSTATTSRIAIVNPDGSLRGDVGQRNAHRAPPGSWSRTGSDSARVHVGPRRSWRCASRRPALRVGHGTGRGRRARDGRRVIELTPVVGRQSARRRRRRPGRPAAASGRCSRRTRVSRTGRTCRSSRIDAPGRGDGARVGARGGETTRVGPSAVAVAAGDARRAATCSCTSPAATSASACRAAARCTHRAGGATCTARSRSRTRAARRSATSSGRSDSLRRPMISAHASWYVPAGNSFGRVPGTTTERGGT